MLVLTGCLYEDLGLVPRVATRADSYDATRIFRKVVTYLL